MRQKIEEDRISSLPDDLILDILSFLEMRDVVRTSAISKNWRNFWKSVPCVSIARIRWSDGSRFRTCGDKVLLEQEHEIDAFALCGSDGIDPGIADMWIKSVVERHAKEIYLQWMDTITTTINIIGRSIKSLRLMEVTIFGLSEGQVIQLFLTGIEDFYMKDCNTEDYDSLLIAAPQLKCLTFGDRNSCFSKIQIITPKLKSLKFKADVRKDYRLCEMTSLDDAHIDTYMKNGKGKRFHRCLSKILEAISGARCLTLSTHVFELYSNIVTSFPQLKHLKLTGCCTVVNNRVLGLLRYYPEIETQFLGNNGGIIFHESVHAFKKRKREREKLGSKLAESG